MIEVIKPIRKRLNDLFNEPITLPVTPEAVQNLRYRVSQCFYVHDLPDLTYTLNVTQDGTIHFDGYRLTDKIIIAYILGK